MIFFISRREQEVSQLTGVNAANCAADKRGDAEKRGGEEEEEGEGEATAGCCLPKGWMCACSLRPAPSYGCGGFHGGECVNTRMHVKYDES